MIYRRLLLLLALLMSVSALGVLEAASASKLGMAGLEAREQLAGLLKHPPRLMPQGAYLSAIEEFCHVDDDGERHQDIFARTVTVATLRSPDIESRGTQSFVVIRPHRPCAMPPTGPPVRLKLA